MKPRLETRGGNVYSSPSRRSGGRSIASARSSSARPRTTSPRDTNVLPSARCLIRRSTGSSPALPSAGPREALCEAAEIASGPDAPAHLCSRAERRGARPARSGPARVGRVHRAPGADRAGERGGTPAAGDRARPALCGADGPQRRPRLQRRRPGGPDGRLVAAEERRAGAGRGRAGAAARDPAPAAARLRPPEEHLDPRPPGAGGARARAEPGRPLGGDDPAGVAAARGGLEAGRALAHQPRSRLRARKRRRDRLIGLARGRPGWAFGFQDEVWFSRFAQPSLHAWAADGERPRLAAHAADPADPEPKALARYGLWPPGAAGGGGGGWWCGVWGGGGGAAVPPPPPPLPRGVAGAVRCGAAGERHHPRL